LIIVINVALLLLVLTIQHSRQTATPSPTRRILSKKKPIKK